MPFTRSQKSNIVTLFSSIVFALVVERQQVLNMAWQTFPSAARFIDFLIWGIATVVLLQGIVREMKESKAVQLIPSLLLMVLVAILYVATAFRIGYPKTPVSEFAKCVFLVFLFARVAKVNTRCVLLSILVISAASFILCPKIYFSHFGEHVYWFGITRVSLPAMIAAMVYVCHYLIPSRGKIGSMNSFKRFALLLVLSANAVIFFRVFFNGSRGGQFVVLTFLAYLFVSFPDDSGQFRIHRKRLSGLVLAILAGVLFFEPGIRLLNAFLQAAGLNVHAVERFVAMMDCGDVSAGRFEIWSASWRGFLEHPLLGNGIDSSPWLLGYYFAHNLILQLLYDGGIVLFLAFVCPVVAGLVKPSRFSTALPVADSYGWKVMAIYLFFISVTPALLSHNVWTNISIWLLAGFAFASLSCRPRLKGILSRRERAIRNWAIVLCVVFAGAGVWAFRAFRTNPSNIQKPDTCPLVIQYFGSSARADHFQLYGYDRETNPYLGSVPNKIVFTQAYSAGSRGNLAMQDIFTDDFQETVASAGDYAFLSSRALSPAEFKFCRKAVFRKLYLHLNSQSQYDSALQPNIEKAFDGGCRNIVVTSCGSRLFYDLRYPEVDCYFEPSYFCSNYIYSDGIFKEDLINAYDNTIRFTDKCIGRLIDWADSLDIPATILYVSDSGEILRDGSVWSEELQRHVPLIVWYSDEYQSLYPDRIATLESIKDEQITTSGLSRILKILN